QRRPWLPFFSMSTVCRSEVASKKIGSSALAFPSFGNDLHAPVYLAFIQFKVNTASILPLTGFGVYLP
ncbi:Os03g0789800, partial [Oryza sativa Japonica Group]